jgi:hypothetical protein
MALRKPLVIISGQLQEIPAGDTLNASVAEIDIVQATNGEVGAIVIGTPVYVSAAGTVKKAAANAGGTRSVLGLVKDVSIAGAASGSIQTDGILTATTGQWDAVAGTTGGLVAGSIYYLSATAGLLTSTAPVTGGQYVCEVGIAISTTELDINTDTRGVLLA